MSKPETPPHEYSDASQSIADGTSCSDSATEQQRLIAQNAQLIERLRMLEQAHSERNGGAQQPVVQNNNIEPNLNPAAEVNLVRNLRLPPFWRENPALWFAQVEAAFNLHQVRADSTRFHHIVTQLDSQSLPAISDIILNPPAHNKYEAVKSRILSSYDESSESKMRKLLQGIEPTNDKPTLILQRIRNLAGGQVGDAFLRTIFLNQLPEFVRGVLAISGNADLSALALQADKVMEATSSNSSVYAVSRQTSAGPEVASASREAAPMEAMFSGLIDAIANLSKDVQSLKLSASRSRSASRSDSRSDTRSAQRSSSRSSPPNDGDVCHFHRKFGRRACNCDDPCTLSYLVKKEKN